MFAFLSLAACAFANALASLSACTSSLLRHVGFWLTIPGCAVALDAQVIWSAIVGGRENRYANVKFFKSKLIFVIIVQWHAFVANQLHSLQVWLYVYHIQPSYDASLCEVQLFYLFNIKIVVHSTQQIVAHGLLQLQWFQTHPKHPQPL
jgi:hypothetical protein